MSVEAVQEDLAFLASEIVASPDRMQLLRSTFEAALMRLGHDNEDIVKAVDLFYARALH